MNTSTKLSRNFRRVPVTLLSILLAGTVAAPCAWAAKSPKPPAGGQVLPWGVHRIGADAAWGFTSGRGIRVAILDTGVDRTHPDLSLNIKGGFNSVGAADAYDDVDGHGTGIAGVIAALNNSVGVVGVGPELEVYAVKFREHSGLVPPDPGVDYAVPSTYSFNDLYEGLEWCLRGPDGEGVDVICMSFGIWSLKEVKGVLQRDMPMHDPSFYACLQQAYSGGIVLVAAAGNSGREIRKLENPSTEGPAQVTSPEYDFPASYPEVIAVAAAGFQSSGKPSQQGDYFPTWSNFGGAIALSAPGVSIKTTAVGGGYATFSGTSLASPHVAATVGLLLASHGPMTPAEVLAHLTVTAEPLFHLDPNGWYGAGMVDAENAVYSRVSR